MTVFESLAISRLPRSYGALNATAASKTPRRQQLAQCLREICYFPKKLPRVLQLLRTPMDIPPNFGVKQFKKKKEATGFLRRFGFELILTRSDCDVWQTKEEPKVRA